MPVNRLFSEDITGAQAVVRILVDAGIDTVFGIPGGHASRIFEALGSVQDRIRTIVVREESLGSVMAETQGRLTGRPGVLLGQGSWLLGNGLIGILEAFLSSSPLLLLADLTDNPQFTNHAPYQSGTGDYGSWDARRAFSGVTKQVFAAIDPIPAVQATQLAIKHAMLGQPGPVAVLYSTRALSGTVQSDARPRIYPTRNYLPPPPRTADDRAVERVAQVLLAAQRPVIIAGNGTRVGRAYAPLQQLAETLGVPVATTPTGKGCFNESHALALGPIGVHGAAVANEIVGDADVVLVIGSKLGAYDTIFENPALLDPERQTLIQVEIEPRNAAWTFPMEYTLIGDAGLVLGQLNAAVAKAANLPERREAGSARVEDARGRNGYFNSPLYRSDASPVHPQRAVGELIRALPDDSIVTLDAGENRLFMMNLYQTRAPGAFLQPAGAGPMGYAIPAALGAKLVNPDRVAVAVCGDGGFSMTMNGLMTSIEHNIPIIVVVFNNRALGWVKHGPTPFADLADFDHAAIARAMGCNGVRVETGDAMREALREAVSAPRSTVIDVCMALDGFTYADVTSPLMKPAPPQRAIT